MGASILPVAINNNNELVFLFGKERCTDETVGWSDFGGGTEHGETLLKTAIREGEEELSGFLGNKTHIANTLKQTGYFYIDYNNVYKGVESIYRIYIYPIKYDELLPDYYNNNHHFLQKKMSKNMMTHSKFFEKVQLKWFKISELNKFKPDFRIFYQNIIPLLEKNKNAIKQFTKNGKKSKRRNKNNYKNKTIKK